MGRSCISHKDSFLIQQAEPTEVFKKPSSLNPHQFFRSRSTLTIECFWYWFPSPAVIYAVCYARHEEQCWGGPRTRCQVLIWGMFDKCWLFDCLRRVTQTRALTLWPSRLPSWVTINEMQGSICFPKERTRLQSYSSLCVFEMSFELWSISKI